MMTQLSNAASAVELSLPMTADSIATAALFGQQHALTLRSDAAAVRELAGIVEDRHASLTRFLLVTLKSCSADTAGVTLLEHGAGGKPALRWDTIAGELAAQEGFAPPRNFSSCGMCLDRAEPLLLTEPQQVFTYLGEMSPSISELLVIPLHDGLQPLGTLWMAKHDPTRRFCADDARIAERLALHLASALKLSLLAKDHRRAMAYRDAQLQDAHHRVKNTLQIAVSTLELDAHATTSDSARVALRIGIGRLRILAKVHELLGHETGNEQVAVSHATACCCRRSIALIRRCYRPGCAETLGSPCLVACRPGNPNGVACKRVDHECVQACISRWPSG